MHAGPDPGQLLAGSGEDAVVTVDGVPDVAGVVLAAGAGRRLGGPKAALVVGGRTLLEAAVAALAGGGCRPVSAVVRPGTAVPPGVTAVVNLHPDRGMRSSLALAIEASGDAAALAVLLVDTPGIGAGAVARTVAAARPGRIAVATFGGRRGHPVVMAPRLWARALTLAGPDQGARALLTAHPDLVDEVPVAGDPSDLDTQVDLDRWTRARARARDT